MKILVFSSTPWNDDNSFGNSYSSIFKGIEGLEFANISFGRYLGQTDSEIVSKSFQVTTKMLVKNLLNKKQKVGVEGYINEQQTKEQNIEQTSLIKFAKSKRWTILFWGNDLIWKFGRWKNRELINFINDFKPDLIFQPIYYSKHLNTVCRFIKKQANVPMVGYVSDDVYTLKQFSLSPLYWIDRLITRRYIKKTVKQCSLLYTISEVQKAEYEKTFGVPCKILTKSKNFHEPIKLKENYNNPLQIVYTGNIGSNRWKSLAMITDALKEVNKDFVKAELKIYTATYITPEMNKALNVEEFSKIMGVVPASEVKGIQENADILVHAEGLDLKSRLSVRQSFSTKIVDYFKIGRPILAVGPKSVASINHLLKSHCAIIAESRDELVDKLNDIINSPDKMNIIAKNGYECGKRYHNKKEINEMLKSDLEKIVNG